MYTDLFGKTRAKVGLHIHTTRSDGRKTPEEVAAIYQNAGFDMIALTDHWIYGHDNEINGLPIIPGCEYNFGETLKNDPIYHIIALGMKKDPMTFAPDLKRISEKEITPSFVKANQMIEAIHKAGGIADLAHPAWSLNNDTQIKMIKGADATEIYNNVSDWGMSNRPYSGCVIDDLATQGIYYPLLAVDDTHYYDGDECKAYIMAEVDHLDVDSVLSAIQSGNFYATQGPEVHLTKEADGQLHIQCSPCSRLVFMSNRVWAHGRIVRGENITEAFYTPLEGESFMRAEVTDASGKTAWSNIIAL